jgi:methionine-S-sulfoxide reductase
VKGYHRFGAKLEDGVQEEQMTSGRFLSAILVAVLAGAMGWLYTASPGEAKAPLPQETEKATFAGGCFWCMEPPFDKLEGVLSTTSGYTGGERENPTYEQVSSGGTGHLEAVQIVYDPAKVNYAELLDVFWRNIDPTDAGGQFCDRGQQYWSGIFYYRQEQRRLAEESKAALKESGRLPGPIVTAVRKATAFYPAEEYHQDYYKKNPFRYRIYRLGCGRDRVLERLWGATDH